MTSSLTNLGCSRLDLFGGTKVWEKTEWVVQDDRLRGGSSISHLTITTVPSNWPNYTDADARPPGGTGGTIATFHGTLDSKTLGGAGFASQRTEEEDQRWDLSSYDGLELVVLIPLPPPSNAELLAGEEPKEEESKPAAAPIAKNRIYTLLLKDHITPGEPDSGREISWQWDFKPRTEIPKGSQTMVPFLQKFVAHWEDFKPFYRGRSVDDPDERLNTKAIRRFSIMIRSFFQDQEDGGFSVSLVSISAVKSKDAAGIDR